MNEVTITKFFVQTSDPWGGYGDSGGQWGGYDNVNDAKEAASKMPRIYANYPPRVVKRVTTETLA